MVLRTILKILGLSGRVEGDYDSGLVKVVSPRETIGFLIGEVTKLDERGVLVDILKARLPQSRGAGGASVQDE